MGLEVTGNARSILRNLQAVLVSVLDLILETSVGIKLISSYVKDI
jgi:hypothetical protein